MSIPTSDDRRAAVDALQVHLAAGRLDPADYENRQVAADAAQTWEQIEALFRDLPSPRVARGGDYGSPGSVGHDGTAVELAAGRRPEPSPQPSPPSGYRSDQYGADQYRTDQYRGDGQLANKRGDQPIQRLMAVVPLIALVLFLISGQWWFFLMIPIIYTLAPRGWRR